MNSPAGSPCGACSWDSQGPTSTVPSAGGFAIACVGKTVYPPEVSELCCWGFGCCLLIQMLPQRKSTFVSQTLDNLTRLSPRGALSRLLYCGRTRLSGRLRHRQRPDRRQRADGIKAALQLRRRARGAGEQTLLLREPAGLQQCLQPCAGCIDVRISIQSYKPSQNSGAAHNT